MILSTKSLAQIEKAQKAIILQQQEIESAQDDIDQALDRVKETSKLILIQIQEMRTGKTFFISKELEDQIKRTSRLARGIDRKVEDNP